MMKDSSSLAGHRLTFCFSSAVQITALDFSGFRPRSRYALKKLYQPAVDWKLSIAPSTPLDTAVVTAPSPYCFNRSLLPSSFLLLLSLAPPLPSRFWLPLIPRRWKEEEEEEDRRRGVLQPPPSSAKATEKGSLGWLQMTPHDNFPLANCGGNGKTL